MVMAVFVDIIPFVIILMSSIFIFAFVWRFSPYMGYKGSQANELIQLSFYQSVYDSTGIIMGNSPQVDEYSGERFTLIRYIVILMGNIILSLVLLNLLIAIVSNTYERVKTDRYVHDAREILYIVMMFDILLSRKDRKEKERYIMSVRKHDESNGVEEDSLRNMEKRVERLDDKIDEVIRSNLESSKKIDELSSKIERFIENFQVSEREINDERIKQEGSKRNQM